MIKIENNPKDSKFYRFNKLLSKIYIRMFEIHDSINEHNKKNSKFH